MMEIFETQVCTFYHDGNILINCIYFTIVETFETIVYYYTMMEIFETIVYILP